MEVPVSRLNVILEQYVIPYAINFSLALLIFFFGRIVVGWIRKLLNKVLIKANLDKLLVEFISGIVHSLLLLFVIIAALGQLGVDTTSLVALIGAAGLAVGLSLKNSLENFASGVMLIMFRPFKVGDFVEVAGQAGVVEKTTLFTTEMRTGDNKSLIIPNGKIYGDVIVNYSAKDTRRVDMTFGIGYEDDIKAAKQILQRLVDADNRILDEPEPLIAVAELADSSVNFTVRPWVKSAEYWAVFFDFQEKVKVAFNEAGISIPYPQMDVHLNK